MNEIKPIVSVICLSYNHEHYIRQAIDSILMQKTTFPIEVLVGEDCSPDNTRIILKEYECQFPDVFKMFYREKNIGGTANIYDLFTKTTGKYVITLETDDYWTDPYKLQKQVDFLEEHPEYIGCAHNCTVVNEKNEKTGEQLPETTIDSLFTLNGFMEKGFVFQTATLMYRNFFLDGGDYSIIKESHQLVHDLTINSILLSRGNIFIIPEYMSAYRKVIKKGGTNAASISADAPAKTLLETMHQIVMLDKYFHGRIDYSPRKLYPVERYLTGLLRRENGFSSEGMKYMWKNSGGTVRKQTINYVIEYPIRKINKLFGEK